MANEHQIILAADVTDQANDKLQVVPMVDQARQNLDAAGVEEAIGAALADSGFYSETNTAALEQRGIDPYVATERLKHNEKIAVGAAGPHPQGPVGEAADGAEAADEEGPGAVREAEGDDRADLRPVEAGAGVPAVLAARPGGDAGRVAVDGDGAQPAEAVAARSRSGDGGVIRAANGRESSVRDR